MSAKRLNEMKVAGRLIDARLAEEEADGRRAWELLARDGLTTLSEIAWLLADAPYLFRDDVVIRIADLLKRAADMEDLYEGTPDEQG